MENSPDILSSKPEPAPKTAVAAAEEPPPPLKLIVGAEVYPKPPWVITIFVTAPLAICAVPNAVELSMPAGGAEKVTSGAEVYPDPPLLIVAFITSVVVSLNPFVTAPSTGASPHVFKTHIYC